MRDKTMLAILGGPHTAGRTAAMLDCAIEAAQRAGWKVQQLHLYDCDLKYCSGCRVCDCTGECVQKDDGGRIAQLLRNSGVVALAAPTYWANVPAAVKNFFDRMVGVAMQKTRAFPKPRLSSEQRYLLLTSCDTPAPFSSWFGQSSGAFQAMEEFFKTSGMKRLGRIAWTGGSERSQLPSSVSGKIERCFR